MLFLFLLSITLLAWGHAGERESIEPRSLRLKNIDKTVMIPVGDSLVPIRVHKKKAPGGVTIFMNGIDSRVDFLPSSTSFLNVNPSSIPYEGDMRSFSTSSDNVYDILKAEVENAPNCDQVIIAHSYGGLRAIAYASIMAQLGLADRIKGIIFIGSPVRGFPLLADLKDEYGRIKTGETRVDEALSQTKVMFSQAVQAVKEATNFDDYIRNGGDELYNSKVQRDGNWQAKFLDLYRVQQLFTEDDFIPLTITSRLGKSALSALKPNGEFARKYLGIDFQQDRFQSQSISEDQLIPTTKVLPDSIRIGFIVGTNSDPIDLIADARTRNLVRAFISIAPNFLGISDNRAYQSNSRERRLKTFAGIIGNIHNEYLYNEALINKKTRYLENGKYIYAEGDVKFWLEIRNDFALPLNEDRVQSLMSTLSDVRRAYGALITGLPGFGGTYTNDSFIPAFAQWRTIAGIGGRAIGRNGEFKREASTAVHAANPLLAENGNNYEIWGESGGWQTAIGSSGIVAEWYDGIIADPSTPATERSSWNMAKKALILNY